jgi:hypothetical protein
MCDIPIVLMTSHIGQGSNFVRSLLDGHPEIALIRQDISQSVFIDAYNCGKPFDPMTFADIFFKYHYTWPVIGKDSLETLRALDSDKKIHEFNYSNWITISNKVRRKVNARIKEEPDKINNLIDFLSQVAITQHNIEFSNEEPKAVFINIHFILVNRCTEWPPDSISLNYGGFGGEFMKLFALDKRIKILALARNPYALYGCAVYTPRRARMPIIALSQILVENLIFRSSWEIDFGHNRFKSLKMEDLQVDPDTTLQSLAKFMGVTYLPEKMKETTVFGLFWEGKSHHGQIKTFDPSLKSNNIWISNLTFFESIAVTICSFKLLKNLGYKLRGALLPSILLFPLAVFSVCTQIPNFQYLRKHHPEIGRFKYVISSFKHVLRIMTLLVKRPLRINSKSVKDLIEQQPQSLS